MPGNSVDDQMSKAAVDIFVLKAKLCHFGLFWSIIWSGQEIKYTVLLPINYAYVWSNMFDTMVAVLTMKYEDMLIEQPIDI